MQSDAIMETPESFDQRRQQVPGEVDHSNGNQLDKISERLTGFQLSDLFSASRHSRDFRETRAEYIVKRQRFMLVFFIIAVPAWIPIDYFTLEQRHFHMMTMARLVLMTVLIMIWFLSMTRVRLWSSSAVLFAMFIVPSFFYVIALQILQSGTPEAPLAGYTAMPYLMATLLGLFPLTLLFGSAILMAVVFFFAASEMLLGTLASHESLSMLWILLLICGIVLWIQSCQLLMLLKLYRESTSDPLTGLINRRVLIKDLKAEIQRHNDYLVPVSLMMLDLDRFKRINDVYGHLVGDQVLKVTAAILINELRESDTVARFGGEEFMVIVPGINGRECLPVAERIRRAIEAAKIETPEGAVVEVSTSIGLVEFRSGETSEEVFSRVDDLLYQAKDRGRNQVVSCFN